MNLNQQCGIILIRNPVSHQQAAAPPLLPCLVGEQVFNASVDNFQLRIFDQMAKREGFEVVDTLPRLEYCSRKTSLDRADFPVEADDHGGADEEGASFCYHLADSPSLECCGYNTAQMTL